jgi:hypothetical protein
MIDFFLSLQIWGTPDQCYARAADILKRVDAEIFIPVFSYAGMPVAEAERNARLFARELLPEVKKL